MSCPNTAISFKWVRFCASAIEESSPSTRDEQKLYSTHSGISGVWQTPIPQPGPSRDVQPCRTSHDIWSRHRRFRVGNIPDTPADFPGSQTTQLRSLVVFPTVRGFSPDYSFKMKTRKIPHLRVSKPYPPTFGCSACAATFQGPKNRPGLAKEFADHVRQQHPRPELTTEAAPRYRTSK